MRAFRLTTDELPVDTATLLSSHSFFASPGFAKLWQSVGGRAVYWVVELNSRMVAILPAVEFGRKPLLRLQAMPDGCYASLVMIDSDIDETARANACTAILSAIAGYGYARVFITDQQNQFTASDKFQVQACSTTLIDISDPEWKPAQKKLRTEIRGTQRRGVEAIAFERERHFDSFLQLIEIVGKGPQRLPKNPERFYSALADLAEVDSRIRWLVIVHEQRIVASLVSVVERDMVLAWHGCIDRESASDLNSMNLLVHTIITMMKQEGVRYFNFGASPRGATGIEAFKKKWRGEEFLYQTLVFRSGLGKLK